MEGMRQTGIHNKTLSGYENGFSKPDLSTLTTLLKLYRVSADRLLGLEAKNPSIVVTPEESDLLALFRTFSETERSELLLALRAIIDFYRPAHRQAQGDFLLNASLQDGFPGDKRSFSQVFIRFSRAMMAK